MGFRTFTTVGKFLWYSYSPVCGSPTGRFWIWFDRDCAPSYCHAAASSFSLDVEYIFLVGSSLLLSMVVQQLVVILLVSQEEMSTHPSIPPAWTGRFNFFEIKKFFSFFLMNLANGLSILFIFWKNQLLVLLIFAIVLSFFFFHLFLLWFYEYFLVLTLEFFVSFFSGCYRCKVRLIIW